MNESPVKSWSVPMKIVLPILASISALICVLSAMTLFEEGKIEAAVIARAVGGAVAAVFLLYVRIHPEWQRSLEEKF
jgi:hypothetical protein